MISKDCGTGACRSWAHGSGGVGSVEGLYFLKRRSLMARHNGTNRQAWGDSYPFIVVIHGDRFPGAVLHTERAANASIQIHLDDFQQIMMLRSRDDFDTIWRADNDTRFTPRTSLLINHRELPRFTLANRLSRHTHNLGHLLWDMTSGRAHSA